MTDHLATTGGDPLELDLRCSVVNLARGADPIGTAGRYDAYLLVDVPLPWPPDIADHPLLAELPAVLAAVPGATRVQGTVPSDPEALTHRMVAYRRRPGAFRAYARAEAPVAAGATAQEIAAVGRRLLTEEATGAPAGGASLDVSDVLVCTHGRRDRCCGSMGTNLFTEVVARGVAGVRLTRTSHLGGHRFAPTALFLPEGTVWAWLEPEQIETIARRSAPLADVLPHYRGSSALGGPAVQVCERAAFAEEGWGWLDAARTAEVVADGDGVTTVRVRCERADGTRGAYEGTVRVVGRLPQPVCGVGEVADGKFDPVFELRDFRAVEPT